MICSCASIVGIEYIIKKGLATEGTTGKDAVLYKRMSRKSIYHSTEIKVLQNKICPYIARVIEFILSK